MMATGSRRYSVEAVPPLLEVSVQDDVPNSAASAGIGMALAALGLRVERASRVRTIVEELIVEARAREPFPDADGQASMVLIRLDQLGHNARVFVTDFRMPLQSARSHRLPSRRLASLGFVDSLHISNQGRDGNIAVCTIALDDNHGSTLDGVEVLPADVTPVLPDVAAELVIREMVGSDVAGLIRCVYRCYGYSYPDDIVYKPSVLRRMLRTGLMKSVVAIGVDGEVVGHCSLTFAHPNDRVPEAGRLVVDPRYRGHQLASRLGHARNHVAKSLGLPGLWSECVTNHVASQRNLLSLGGVETGLLIGAGPSDVVMSGLSNENDGRRTLMPFYVPLDAPARGKNYVSVEHLETCQVLAARLGLEREWSVETQPLEGDTHVSVDVSPISGVAFIRLISLGENLVEVVGSELDALIAYELGAVHIDIPLSDPGAASAVVVLERHGFCWGNWIPNEHAGTDVLRLQRVGEHLTDVSHVLCAREEGEHLRDWVVSEWHRVRRGLSDERVGYTSSRTPA